MVNLKAVGDRAPDAVGREDDAGTQTGEGGVVSGIEDVLRAFEAEGKKKGKAVSGAAEAVARNPGARAGIQTLLVLGLAFIESLAIFTLLIIFVK